jgi:hypothetical protein
MGRPPAGRPADDRTDVYCFKASGRDKTNLPSDLATRYQSLSIALLLASPRLGSMWKARENRRTVLILAIVFAALILGVTLLGSPENTDVGYGFTGRAGALDRSLQG